MTLERTRDYPLVQEIITHPSVYGFLGDDSLPPREEFRVNDHPAACYLLCHNGRGLVGMFCLYPVNTVCWDSHVVMLPYASKQEKLEAAHGLVPWLEEHTDCRRLVASVPECRRMAIAYAVHGVGMRYVGRQPKAFLYKGKLRDLILLGRPVNKRGNPCLPQSQV